MGGNSNSDDVEMSTNLMRIISRFSLTLRNVSCGDYRDEIASRNECRVQFLILEKLQELKTVLKQNVPNLDSEDYCNKLTSGMTEMRGR